MDAPNVAAHAHMSTGGAAGGELTPLIINKVINEDTQNVSSHQRVLNLLEIHSKENQVFDNLRKTKLPLLGLLSLLQTCRPY